MIKFHPTQQQLLNLAEGLVSPAEGIIVSAHCDMCSQCQRKVMLYTEAQSEEIFEDIACDYHETSFGNMLSAITSEEVDTGIVAAPKSGVLELDGRKFTLPRTLSRLSESTGNWSHLVGKLWQAPVNIGGETVANFMFMEKGGRVPEHTHRGSEMTLVVNGSYSDGFADYTSGDFTTMDETHVHAPAAHKTDGCLVFTILDQPLHFTSGWARLINPFSHLFFK